MPPKKVVNSVVVGRLLFHPYSPKTHQSRTKREAVSEKLNVYSFGPREDVVRLSSGPKNGSRVNSSAASMNAATPSDVLVRRNGFRVLKHLRRFRYSGFQHQSTSLRLGDYGSVRLLREVSVNIEVRHCAWVSVIPVGMHIPRSNTTPLLIRRIHVFLVPKLQFGNALWSETLFRMEGVSAGGERLDLQSRPVLSRRGLDAPSAARDALVDPPNRSFVRQCVTKLEFRDEVLVHEGLVACGARAGAGAPTEPESIAQGSALGNRP